MGNISGVKYGPFGTIHSDFNPHVTCMQQQCAEIKYVSVVVSVCTPPLLICLSHPLACQHASTSHTLALGRSGSTRDVPAKSSSTSSLDPNTCNTKPWQPPSTHYQSYSIYRRYTSLTTGTTASHTLACPLHHLAAPLFTMTWMTPGFKRWTEYLTCKCSSALVYKDKISCQ